MPSRLICYFAVIPHIHSVMVQYISSFPCMSSTGYCCSHDKKHRFTDKKSSHSGLLDIN
ncbi:hypothetical protein ymoll0001_7120 [Yersinia mollaretii ATCC 43969]|uniref:Uncharacterized protein n=1 Tax=Yersinia mollaretii (strain ATCC 43969 / DSM 18520 / CIP 103324 / CNY 7263 / WAIP 204) TaxID=349967 RepID=A0ABM9Y9I6_YERMW|nr:hypothetical protein ymoll0001_7120 [Yersinia mollaretii ATCC 43969]